MSTAASQQTRRLSALLRGAGFKATPHRLAVLALLEKSKKPLSIKKIRDQLRRKDLDQATLYRMVNALEQAGLLRAVDFRHSHAHYELEGGERHHHHIVCQSCGKLADIFADTSRLEAQALKMSKFAAITSHSLEFFGLCRACARALKES
jgi:Fur family ferric uptake transcriptional regulator